MSRIYSFTTRDHPTGQDITGHTYATYDQWLSLPQRVRARCPPRGRSATACPTTSWWSRRAGRTGCRRRCGSPRWTPARNGHQVVWQATPSAGPVPSGARGHRLVGRRFQQEHLARRRGHRDRSATDESFGIELRHRTNTKLSVFPASGEHFSNQVNRHYECAHKRNGQQGHLYSLTGICAGRSG